MAEDDHGAWGLVLPFKAVRSVGGPYDDEAFCAGYDVGRLHALMRTTSAQRLEELCRTVLLDQLDLCAMEAGWVIVSREPTLAPGWSYIELQRSVPTAL